VAGVILLVGGLALARYLRPVEARATTRSLATKVSDAEVRALVDGVVLAQYIELGEVVAVNQALFKVGDPQSLFARSDHRRGGTSAACTTVATGNRRPRWRRACTRFRAAVGHRCAC